MAPRTKVEKRMDATEGVKYSEEEFIEYYGKKAGAKKWTAAGQAAPAATGKACTVCGKTNHTKADCKLKDKECSNCGKVGHIAKVCRQAGGGQEGGTKAAGGAAATGKACTVCGKTNHTKADCKLKDKECSNCGKTGHIAKVCRQAGGGAEGGSKAGNDKAKSAPKAKAKVKAKAKESKPRKELKVCVCGGSGGIGQPLCMQMAMDSNCSELSVYDLDIAMVPTAGVAADLSHIETKCKVVGYCASKDDKPIDKMEACLTGCNLVLVPAGLPRKPGQTRDDLFAINAGIAKGIVEACAKFCPDAVVALIVNPVNSIVPAMSALYEKKGLNPLNILGVTTLDCVRANKFVGEITGKNPKYVSIPVVGGHAGATILPLFSQDKSAASIEAAKIPDLDKKVQDAGTVVVEAKGGKGSATLSMAYAGARMGSSILAGLQGRRRVECAYVKSDVADGLAYFSSKVVLGEKGVTKVLPIGDLSEHEKTRLEEVKTALKAEIQTGLDYAEKNSLA